MGSRDSCPSYTIITLRPVAFINVLKLSKYGRHYADDIT